MDAETAIQADAVSKARLDLAAVYRLLAQHGWGDVIFNHAAMRVPSNPRHFLIKRHELLYTEVTASNMVEVSMDDDLDERSGVNRPGFTLHSGVLRARPDVNCSVHGHPEEGIALSGLKQGLRPLSQNAMRFYNRGAELLEIPAEVCERVAAHYEQHDKGRASAEWPAYLRQPDSIDSGFRA